MVRLPIVVSVQIRACLSATEIVDAFPRETDVLQDFSVEDGCLCSRE